MEKRSAFGAKGMKGREIWAVWNQVRYSVEGGDRLSAPEAVELTGCEGPPAGLFSALEKAPDRGAAHDDGAALVCHRKSRLDPRPDRVFADLQRSRGLFDGVSEVLLDPPGVEPMAAHQPAPFSISSRMSSTRQTVTRGPSFRGFG